MSTLMNLPRELRDLIIDNVIRSPQSLPPDATVSRAEWAARGNDIPAFPAPTCSNLLLTSRQLSFETRERLHKQPIRFVVDCVLFTSPSVLCTWLSVPAALPGRSLIDRVDINFRIPPLLESDFWPGTDVRALAILPGALAKMLLGVKTHNLVCQIIEKILSGDDTCGIFPVDPWDKVGASARYCIREVRINFNSFNAHATCKKDTQITTDDEGKIVLYTGSSALEACATVFHGRMRRYIFNWPIWKCKAHDRSPQTSFQLYVTRVGDMAFYVGNNHCRSIAIPEIVARDPTLDTEKAVRMRNKLDALRLQHVETTTEVLKFLGGRRSDNELYTKLIQEEAKSQCREFRRENGLGAQL